MQSFAGKRVTVFGLGRFGGGIAVTQWLVKQGAKVLVADQDGAEKLAESVGKLSGLPVELRLGNAGESDFTQTDLIVASPAVPPHNPQLLAASSAGVPITTEIRLFVERCCAPIFGITGTKGKSTTTAMLGEILRRGFTVHVGGNIGGSLLEKVEQIRPRDLVVLELSSYMLEHLGKARFSPHVAVVTLIGADHLDWHGSREAYVGAKKNILRYQKKDDFAVFNGDDPGASAMAGEALGKVVRYSLSNCRAFSLQLPGRHNQLNAQGAFAAAATAGVSWETAQDALRDFRGLPHRLQLVHEAGGVRWYNDSIATIPDAAVAALESFDEGKVIQIIGGKDKHLPIERMCDALAKRAKMALCIGATGPMLSRALHELGAAQRECGDLAWAVAMAREIATEGDIVLLSPGYPSYDQFVNFEERGDTFVRLVRQ